MGRATREAYGEELLRLVQENPKIVVLDADLSSSTKSATMKKAAPERFFNMGIAEANMIGHAAGFAASGYTAFASSFAMFATGRPWEQIRNSVAYPHLDVKICASHSGISVGEDGPTHQATEDIAIMRAIPGMEVYVPCDAAEAAAVVRYVAGTGNPCYVRLGRSAVDDLYDADAQIDVTKANVLRRGDKAVIFATGQLVQSSMYAAKKLEEEGVSVTVVDICAIKPCDEEGIVKLLQEHELVFTAEEHSIVGGLGGMICELAAERCPRHIIRIGMKDCYAESADFKTLMHKYKLDGEGVYEVLHSELVR